MRLESAEHRQEKGRTRACRITAWVGGFPCRGQEAPQCALTELSKIARPTSSQTVSSTPVSYYRSVIRRSSHPWKAYAFESISPLHRPSDRARRSAVGPSQSDLRLSRLSRPILGELARATTAVRMTPKSRREPAPTQRAPGPRRVRTQLGAVVCARAMRLRSRRCSGVGLERRARPFAERRESARTRRASEQTKTVCERGTGSRSARTRRGEGARPEP